MGNDDVLAYTIIPANLSSINWLWGTLSSNVIYNMNFSLLTPSGAEIDTIETNFSSPSHTNTLFFTNIKKLYDFTSVEWTIPNSDFSISQLKCDSAGNIISLETSSGLNSFCVRKYNSSGNLINTLITNYVYGEYIGIDVDSSDYIYVARRTNASPYLLEKYDSNGNFQSSFPLTNESGGSLEIHSSAKNKIAIDSAGNVFAGVDYNNYKIYKYDSSGNLLLSFGGYGSGDGKFTSYYGSFAIDSSDNLIVENGSRLQIFDNSGNWQKTLNIYGTLFGIDSSDNLYINPDSGSLLKTDKDGVLITKIPKWCYNSCVDNTGTYLYEEADQKTIKQIQKQ